MALRGIVNTRPPGRLCGIRRRRCRCLAARCRGSPDSRRSRRSRIVHGALFVRVRGELPCRCRVPTRPGHRHASATRCFFAFALSAIRAPRNHQTRRNNGLAYEKTRNNGNPCEWSKIRAPSASAGCDRRRASNPWLALRALIARRGAVDGGRPTRRLRSGLGLPWTSSHS